MQNPKYSIAKVQDKLVLLTYRRLNNSDILDGLFKYDVQSSDDGFEPSAIRPFILVNH
ncbi:MAG: hypothetical protein GX778_07045 [Erysipelothrix sp.]|nr:hypothetical protein [Erysipelothrix sp.]